MDDEVRGIVNFSLYLPAQNVLLGKCERVGAKRRRESFVNENSMVPPPGLSSFRHPCCIERRAELPDAVWPAAAKQQPQFYRAARFFSMLLFEQQSLGSPGNHSPGGAAFENGPQCDLRPLRGRRVRQRQASEAADPCEIVANINILL